MENAENNLSVSPSLPLKKSHTVIISIFMKKCLLRCLIRQEGNPHGKGFFTSVFDYHHLLGCLTEQKHFYQINQRQYYLKDKGHFLKYLEIRDSITSRQSKVQGKVENAILDHFELSEGCHRTSLFHRTTNQSLSNDFLNMRMLWQGDLECTFGDKEQHVIVSNK